MHVGRFGVALLGLVLVAACGGAVAPPRAPAGPRFVTIDVVGATVAPGKIDRTPWDGVGSLSEGVWDDLGKALLLVDPRVAVAEVLGRVANGTLDKPDVRARVELLWGSYAAARELPKRQDSFTPQWEPPAASFAHVPMDPHVAVRVVLTDVDLLNDDPIGIVELTLADLERALAVGGVDVVDVHRQGNGQVLFVHVAVRAELGCEWGRRGPNQRRPRVATGRATDAPRGSTCVTSVCRRRHAVGAGGRLSPRGARGVGPTLPWARFASHPGVEDFGEHVRSEGLEKVVVNDLFRE